MLHLQLIFLSAALAVSLPPEQQLLVLPTSWQSSTAARKDSDKVALRKLQGRFLHITDIHPDPFYRAYSSVDSACHCENGSAGALGAAKSDCDSPLSLMNATFQWINDYIKDDIDFIIWTGDSARHDNDDQIPRSEKQIVDQNKMVVNKFIETFGKDDNLDDPDPTNDFVIPIIPTFGNNDIIPHNIFEPGPNRWTRDYAEIWRSFIPEAQRHSFARGGWFFIEVIPDRLAIFSLNTMYFFDPNTAVDGCERKSEPGYEQMEWLRIQLQFLRQRGMKAFITGHVPPARTAHKQSWDETCWQKYSYWMRQYRDVVAGGIFGHMNIDHFMIQDASDLKYDSMGDWPALSGREQIATDPMFSIESKAAYLTELRDGWTNLPTPPAGLSYSDPLPGGDDLAPPKKGKKHKDTEGDQERKFLEKIGGRWAERFSLSLVSPSVIPNYYPTLRVVEYNITGMENEHPAVGRSRPAIFDVQDEQKSLESPDTTHDNGRAWNHDLKKRGIHSATFENSRHHKKKKPAFTAPLPPPAIAPPGPAYSPQPLTLTSYTQYFANLTILNDEFNKSGISLQEYIGTAQATDADENKPRFQFEVEYDTRTDERYGLGDLTVRSFLDLAHQIAKDAQHGKESGQTEEDASLDGRAAEVSGKESNQEGESEDAKHGEDVVEGDVLIDKNGKRKKKKKGHRKHRGSRTHELWHIFVKRAFVMTKGDDDMDDFE